MEWVSLQIEDCADAAQVQHCMEKGKFMDKLL